MTTWGKQTEILRTLGILEPYSRRSDGSVAALREYLEAPGSHHGGHVIVQLKEDVLSRLREAVTALEAWDARAGRVSRDL